MKFTATAFAFAFLGATSLVTALPTNMTSSANTNNPPDRPDLPLCPFWTDNWCIFLESPWYSDPDAILNYRRCCHSHGCEAKIIGAPMPGDPPMPERPPMAEIADLDAREEMQPHCGAYRSFGCTVDAEFSDGNITENYRKCMWSHGCDPDVGHPVVLAAREANQPRCGSYRSFGCTVDAEFSDGNITENYRRCMWSHGCDPDVGHPVILNVD